MRPWGDGRRIGAVGTATELSLPSVGAKGRTSCGRGELGFAGIARRGVSLASTELQPNGTAKSAPRTPLYRWPRFDSVTIGSPVYQRAHGDSGPAVFQTPHTIKEHKKNAPASPPGFLSRRDWASRPIPILSGPQALPAAGSRKSPRYPKPSRQSDFVIVSCLPLKPMGLSKQAYRPRGV